MLVEAPLLEERRGATALLTLNNPERRNVLAAPMRQALADALDRLDGTADVRAIVITGQGENFSAGGDISGMKVTDIAGGRERFRLTHRLVRLMVENSKPIVAAVQGWCVGAGLSVALCCDTVIAADTARFVTGFHKIGLIADLGLLHTLPARIGAGRARQMLFYGEPVSAARAEAIGLVDQVVPAGTALDVALARAAFFHDAAPLPVALTKSYLSAGLADALEKERNLQSMLFLSDDHAEGKDAFLGKRAPAFKGI